MSTLLDKALDVVRRMPAPAQDDIARAMLRLAGREDDAPLVLRAEERAAIDPKQRLATAISRRILRFPRYGQGTDFESQVHATSVG